MAASAHRRITMRKVDSDPKRMAIMEPTFVGPVIKGNGDVDYVCPSCGTVLFEGMDLGGVRKVAVTCFKCKTTSITD